MGTTQDIAIFKKKAAILKIQDGGQDGSRPEVVICELFHLFSINFDQYLVHTYKIHFCATFVLCVVFKFHYF